MTTRKKIWTALGMFALVLVVAGASVGITLAALSGTVKSTFNVSYQANNVNAEVTAKYTLLGTENDGSGESFTTMKVGSTAEKIEFQENTPANQSTKSFDAVTGEEIKDPAKWLFIAFTFKNTDEDKDLNVTLTYNNKTTTNFTVEWIWDDADTKSPTEGQWTKFTTDQNSDQAIAVQAVPHTTSNTKTLWVRAHITDSVEGATFAGEFSFALQNAA